ncbi:MAG TPA: ABC transporter substrate-binding protein [Acidimicrobiia bacterium]|nr:ABC transporter substrate-binding protein [Acidimicrobiia bacterium]
MVKPVGEGADLVDEVDSLRDKTFRTIGATAVLLGIAVAALAQVESDEEAPTQIGAPTGTDDGPLSLGGTSTSVDQPFHYRVGLLAGVTTTNFWEYVAERPTAWNSYVLGPTKPALYGIGTGNDLVGELAGESNPPLPTSSEDGWRVQLELGGRIAWSDGEPVTAADVVYTFDTVRRLGLGGGWADAFPAEIDEMVADSDTRLTIEFSERPGLGVWPYGVGMSPVMPAHVWAPLTARIDQPAELFALDGDEDVSGGPLQIVNITDETIEAVANPGYPGPEFDTVEYTIFDDEASAITSLREGSIDTILDPNGLFQSAVDLLDDVHGVTLARSPANSVRYLGFNLTRAPMSEPAFRHGLALLLDREGAATTLLDGAAAAYTVLSPANARWFEKERADSMAAPYLGDLEGRLTSALSQLEAAGYSWDTQPTVVDGTLSQGVGLGIDGETPAPLTILTPGDEYDPARQDYTQMIETTLELLGFDVRPVVTDFDTVVDLAFTDNEAGQRQYDMYVLGWTLGNSVHPDFYQPLFASDGAANSTGYSDQDFDADVARYEAATGPDTARAALWEMEQTLARDLPYLVLYHPDIVEAYRSDRIRFGEVGVLGGIQGRLGGLADVHPAP